MKKQWMLLVGTVLVAAPSHAQSTLDKYLKTSTEGIRSTGDKPSRADTNKVYNGPNGYWQLDDSRKNGGFCSISYYASGSYAGYIGPVIGKPESFILFSGPTIPPTPKEAKKKIALTTSDGQTQNVMAFHAPNSQSKQSGIILFKLTDIQAAMDEMSDLEEVTIAMDKKQVFSLKWSGGHTARTAMRGCLTTG